MPVGPAGLANCEDLPALGSRLEGKLGARQNPDHIVGGVLATYAMEHPDTFGGRWIDRDSGGVLVLGFTDDPEPHRAAILARSPSPDDYPVVDPRPPITDDRSLGEREDVVIDVVQVRFSELEVQAMRDELMGAIPGEDWRDFGLDGTSYDVRSQRVTLYLVNPPEGALADIAERVPDSSVLCVEVTRTPQPPSGPLDVIPDLDVEDPLVSCPGTPAVRYSQMIDPPSIDEVDHPAVDVLRAELDTPGGEPLPRGRWVVISIDDDSATFAALSEPLYDVEVAERGFRHERWRIAVEDSNGDAHFGTVEAGRTTEGLWQIEQARWCLTDAANSDTVRLSVAWKQEQLWKHKQLQPPADFSDCPMMSEGQYEVPEPLEEGLATPGAVLRENLSPLPTASYTIRVTESTDRMVRWEIMMTGAPLGLTFGNKIAVEDNGWRLRTDEWCHMEPDRL